MAEGVQPGLFTQSSLAGAVLIMMEMGVLMMMVVVVMMVLVMVMMLVMFPGTILVERHVMGMIKNG